MLNLVNERENDTVSWIQTFEMREKRHILPILVRLGYMPYVLVSSWLEISGKVQKCFYHMSLLEFGCCSEPISSKICELHFSR